MPALPVVPNVLRVFLEGFIDNDDVYKWGNVLHVQYGGTAPTDVTCATIAHNIFDQWGTHVSSLCPAPTSLQNVSVTDLSGPTFGEGKWTAVNTGTRGDDSIPANAAVLISYVAQYRWRGGHPRSYLYVGGNADLEGAGHWAGAFVTEVQTHWQDFLTAVLTSGASGTSLNNIVLVRYRDATINPVPPHKLVTPIILNLDIVEATAAAEMASQRRRIGRRKS